MSGGSSEDLSRELAFAHELALAGGELALARYRRRPTARRKGDGTWVTEADEIAEAAIRARIAEVFPEHNVLGEEGGLRAARGGEPDPDAPTWVVDPLDGTSNYVAGIPVWATLVALQVDGESVLGVAHAPALGETYSAERGGGARMNGAPITVDRCERLEEATVIHGSVGDFARAGLEVLLAVLVGRAERDRGFGDFWGHVLVARGAAHLMIDAAPLSRWDIAALEPIVIEAGGRLTGLDGGRWLPGRGCLSSCGALHDEITALHGGVGVPGT